MPALSTLLFFAIASAGADRPPPVIEHIATISIDAIDEASGLARSQIDPDIYWVHNDDGDARLYAIDTTGQRRGRLTLDPAKNRDWEDVSSFTLDGKPYLLVADFGDNGSRRDSLILYIVAEPDLAKDDRVRSEPEWTIEYRYPDGPRDAESIAVDADNQRVLVLSKRDIPPRLYSLPMKPTTGVQVAERLGFVRSLPRPRRVDVENAPRTKSWYWQPSAMDIRDDVAVILTYQGLFVYRRATDETWSTALSAYQCAIPLGTIRDAESAVIAADGLSVYITIEKKRPPLFRITLPDECHE